MQASPAHELTVILRALEVHSPDSFTLGGLRFATGQCGPVVSELSTDQPAELVPLLRELCQALYAHCFARRFAGSLPPESAADEAGCVPDERLAAELAAANQSRGGWDPGWKIYRLGLDGEVQVQKGERFRSSQAGEYAYAGGPGMRPRVGDLVELQVLRESHVVQPGMYFVFGDVLSDQFDDFHRLRFYFHLQASAAPLLVRTLTTALSRYQVPFDFKCQKYRQNYDRLDAAVLYVARRYFDIVSRLLVELPDELGAALQPAVPLFTKRLRDGVAVAEDPGFRRSFGLHRCQLVAEAVLDAWQAGDRSAEAYLRAVTARFASNGLSLERPYLGAGSVDYFEGVLA